MPSFADMKAKAASATSSGVEKLQNVRDRNTSVPMKKTNWDPYSGNPPPPPPPPRTNQKSRPDLGPLPPPPSRTGSIAPSPISPSTSVAPTAPPLPARGPASAPPLPARGPASTPPLPVRGAISTPPLPPRGSSAAPTPTPPTRNPLSTASSASAPLAAGPPPVIRGTRPPKIGHSTPPGPVIDWTNISTQDKDVFFTWLDEYFSKLLGTPIPSRANGQQTPLRVPTKSTSWRPSFGST